MQGLQSALHAELLLGKHGGDKIDRLLAPVMHSNDETALAVLKLAEVIPFFSLNMSKLSIHM